jgi:hypothetical protein
MCHKMPVVNSCLVCSSTVCLSQHCCTTADEVSKAFCSTSSQYNEHCCAQASGDRKAIELQLHRMLCSLRDVPSNSSVHVADYAARLHAAHTYTYCKASKHAAYTYTCCRATGTPCAATTVIYANAHARISQTDTGLLQTNNCYIRL